MNCLENLDKCKASCCRNLPFELNISIGHPLEDYYRKHGVKLIRVSRNILKLIIPHDCHQLTEDNRCKLHGTKDKPYHCRMLDEKTAKLDKIYLTEGCIYG